MYRGFDLLIAYLPEDLPIPHISSLPSVYLKWNKHNTTKLEVIFEWTFLFLYDNVLILLFIPKCKDVHQDVRTY